MSQDLKQATTAIVPLGPFVTSDGTAITGLSLTAGDVRIGINGLSAVSKTDALALTHSQFGWYLCQLDGTDTGTLGRLDIHVSPAKGGLPVWRPLKVVTTDDFNTKYVANFGPAQASTIAGVAQASTIDGVAQASTLDTVNGQFPLSAVAGVAQASVVDGVAQASVVVGVAQASEVAVIAGKFPISHVTAVGIASVVHALSTVGTVNVVQSLTTVGVVQSLSYVTAVGIASVTHSLSSISDIAMASQVSDIGSVLDIVYEVWDRALTGATHNVATSAGRRLRQIEAISVLEASTLASATIAGVELPGTSNINDNFYDHQIMVIVNNTGIGQARTLDGYNGTDKTADVHPDWVTVPDSTSDYLMLGFGEVHVHEIQASGLTSITDELDQNSTTLLAINAQHPLSAVVGVAQASVVNGVAQASTVAGVAQASVVAGVAQATILAAVAQASSLATIGPAKNVAISDFPFFMVKSSDSITPLTSVSPVGFVKKDSGSYASLTNAVAEVSSYGQYVVDITQTEMNADVISLVFTAAGADQVGIVIITT